MNPNPFSPEQFQAVLGQAFDLMDAGDQDGAVVIFNGLLALDPTAAPIYAALGSVLHHQGKLAEAEQAYDAALAIETRNPLALVNRGDLRCKRGDLKGIEDLRLAASLRSPVQARAQALLRRYA